jgi:hydrogenase expression/formation protein HypC
MCLGLACRVDAVRHGDVAVVRSGDRELQVSLLTLDDPVAVGDWVLVHAGFALARLTPEQVADAADIRATTWEGTTTTWEGTT